MKTIVKTLTIIIISFVLATILLSGFTYLYSYTGVHITNNSKATDYTWEPGQWRANMTEGFSWLRMDSNGYNNMEPIRTDIDVLVMGSSHMQAVNVPLEKNVTSLLNSIISDMYFYNIGIAGHKIYNVVNNLTAAIEKYKPRSFIIIETSTVDLSVTNMTQVIEGRYSRIKSYDKGLVYNIQKNIPAVKELYKALEDWYSKGYNQDEPEQITAVEETNDYESVLNLFLNKAAVDCGDRVHLIICYHPETEMSAEGELYCKTDPVKLSLYKEACSNNNIIFVDLTEDFQKAYKEEHVLPYGFINTAVGVGHMNEIGHRIMADRLASIITALNAVENNIQGGIN